ncbi:YHYH domain-containing protein [Psychrobacillus glaciei]|uniref:YHYH domain-containing protein n=1 Tax=Psychrobacillus glaciei TaxID=2283160 RepID=UPI00384BA15E
MAHSGRTDANGGHTCRTNCEKWGLSYGQYHYHNGGTTQKTSTSKSPQSSSSKTGNTKTETIHVDPYTQAETLIKTAESYAGSLKWETSYDYRVSKYSSNPVSQIDMKLYNNTKIAINAAKANTNVFLYSNLEERLNVLNDVYLRTQAYIDAINSGEKLLVQSQNYQSFNKQDASSDKTKNAYNELIKLSQKTNTMIYRVYGKSTREAMLEKYNVE